MARKFLNKIDAEHGVITTENSQSSYGIPVLELYGKTYGPDDVIVHPDWSADDASFFGTAAINGDDLKITARDYVARFGFSFNI